MATASAVMFHKVARIACLVAFIGLLFGGAATAQLPITPPAPVTVGSVFPFNHGSTGTWSQIYQMAIAPNGTILFLDAPDASLYALAPGASEPTLLVGPVASGGSSNCSTLEQANNSDWNSSIVVDKNNTIYIGDRFGSAVAYCMVPYVNGAWTFQASDNWSGAPVGCTNGAGAQCTSGTEVIWPQSMALGDDGTFYVGSSNNGVGNGIWSFTVSGGVASTPTALAVQLEADVSSIAVDHAGNVFFLENVYGSPSSRVDGIREIVKGSPTVVGTSGSGSGLESSLPRIDQGFQGVSGLAFDAWGNLYFGSQQNSAYGGEVNGVFMIPNEGTPTAPNLVWADTVRVSPVTNGFNPLVDPRGYLWISDGNGGSNWAPTGTIAPACVTKTNTTIDQTCTSSSVILWAMGSANVGTSPVGTPGPVQTLYYNFSKPTTGTFTLAGTAGSNFAAVATNPNPDPTVTPAVPPCTSGTTYPAFNPTETTNPTYSWCQYFVQLDTKTAGSVSGELQIVNSNGVVEGSNGYLNGVGQGSNIAAVSTTGAQSVATGLQEPGQVAGDAWGDVFVADATLGTVEEYPVSTTARPFVGTAIYTGTAPTGVAVDAAGDLYIGDSGSVYEIPYVNSALATKEQTLLLKGLGNDLSLAADASGDVFVADKSNKQVIEIPNPQTALLRQGLSNLILGAGAGFTGPSAIATDNSGNVWVADGADLWEITLPYGEAAEVLSGLSAPVTGLAIDPSGSIFVAESSGLWWIPYLSSSGGLSFSQAVQVGSIPALGSAPIGVGLDGFENAYVSYGSGTSAGLSQVGAGGSVDFNNYAAELNPDVPFEYDALLFNLGNAPLTLSAFSGDSVSGANAGDFTVGAATENSPACGPGTSTLPGSFCYLGLVLDALNPAGGQSVASAAVTSNAVNAPALNVALSANTVVDPRSATSISVVVTPSSGVIYPGSVTITVTVSAVNSSNGTPACATGVQCVSLSLTGQPKQTATLTNGVATFMYTGLGGGSYRATAGYAGLGVAGTPPDFAATGNFATFVIAPAAPTFKVAAPTNASTSNITVYNGNTFLASGASDTITASVTSTLGTPTGTVTFCSSYTSGVCTPADASQGTNGAIALSGTGTVTFSTSNLGLGVFNLTAVYSGDPNFASETIAMPAFDVIVPSDEITASPSSLTTKAGTPVTATLTLQPLVGFSTSVSLACTAGSLPVYTECTFGYPGGGAAPGVIPVGNNGTAPTTISVTISTDVCTGNCGITSMLDKSRTNILDRRAPWSLAGLFGLGLIGVIAGRKRMSRYLTLICVALMLSGVFMGLASCTNAGYSTPPIVPQVKTPSNTYNIQIITYNNITGQQNSVTVPLFAIPTTVQ
jgi:Bacterial Ig-like domain (group 3)